MRSINVQQLDRPILKLPGRLLEGHRQQVRKA